MLDLQDRKLLKFQGVDRGLSYLGDGGTSKEEYDEQREEDAPRMYGMDDRCQRCNNDTEGCERLPGIRAVNKAQSRGDGDVGTKRVSESEFRFWDLNRVTEMVLGTFTSCDKSRNSSWSANQEAMAQRR